MADRRQIVSDTSNATRSSRSSTLPSQQSPHPKHRHRHRHYNSLLHKSDQSYPQPREAHARTKTHSHSSHLSPLGEFLSPVKRNVTDGLNEMVGWMDGTRDKEKEPQKISAEIAINPEELARRKQKRAIAERSLEEQYNSLASQVLSQHTALAESRNQMLHMFSHLNTALSSLSRLQTECQTLLQDLTADGVPELVEESTKQLDAFHVRITDIESDSIVKLQSRIEASKEKTVRLGDRLTEVRDRIHNWQEREEEEDRRRRRRVGFVWGSIGVLVLLVVLLLIWGRWNEQLEAQGMRPEVWTEIVIQKERERPGTNSSQTNLEELLKSLRSDDAHNNTHVQVVLEEGPTEENDSLLSSIFDEL